MARDTHRFRVVCAGRRFGKDILGIEEAIGEGIAKGGRIPYIGPTIQQVRDIVWEPLKKRLQPITIGKPNESRLEINFHGQKGPARIVLRGWEAIETERGNKNTFAVFTEVAMFRNFWLQWQEVIRPTLTDLRGGALFLSTPKGYNHFFDLYEMERREQEFKSFHATTYDNPYIAKEEIDAARRQLTEDRFAQEYMAEFKKMEGLVYKDFHRDIHIYTDKKTETVERILGIDFGWTNPTCILLIEKGRDGIYYVSQEWYKTEKTTKEIVEYARSLRPNSVYPDPAEPDRIEELRREKLYCSDVSKDIEAGITAVTQLFRMNRIRIHRDCVNLISELETYHYPEKKPDHNEPELPVKEDDHAVDALRYALYMNAGLSGRISLPATEEQKAWRAAMKRKKQTMKKLGFIR